MAQFSGKKTIDHTLPDKLVKQHSLKHLEKQNKTQKPAEQLILKACLTTPQSAGYLLEEVLQKPFKQLTKGTTYSR